MPLLYWLHTEEFIKAREEGIALLCDYVKINTSNPPGDTEAGLLFLKNIFEKEKIEVKIITSSNNKKSLLARLNSDGSRGKPLVLLNHIDVVPADPMYWTFDPFCGEVQGGYILGRGTLDMKGMGIAQLMCLLLAQRQNIQLKRDLIFLAVPDEETGGFEGAKYVVENHLHEIDPEVVLDEGGFGTKMFSNSKPIFFVSCGQKKEVRLRMRALGEAGHGAQPNRNNPNDILIKALNKLISNPYPIDLHKDIWFSIKKLAKEKSGLARLIVLMYKWPLMSRFIEMFFQNIDFINALIRNTMTITILNAGAKINMIPTTAEAYIDCRMLPHVKIDDVLCRYNHIISDPNVELEIINELYESKTSPFESDFIFTIDEVLKANYQGAIMLPYITPAGTDVKYFREKGVKGYGLFPIIVNNDDLKTLHGNDERISVENFGMGCKLIYETVMNYCI